MYCTTSGKELPDGTSVCDECGTVFSPDSRTAPSCDQTESKGQDVEPESPAPASETEIARRPYMDYKPFSGAYTGGTDGQAQNSFWVEPYRQEGYRESTAPDRTGFAAASLILGIIALCSCCLPIITVPLGILTIIFSVPAMKSGGRGIAVAGLVLGIVALVLGTMMLILILLSS